MDDQEVTSADMHRAYAKDLRFIAWCLGASGLLMIGLSIFLAVVGVNVALVLVVDGVGLVLAVWASWPWTRAREERRYAKSLDLEDGIVDTRELWRLMDHSGAVLDGCKCTMCLQERERAS